MHGGSIAARSDGPGQGKRVYVSAPQGQDADFHQSDVERKDTAPGKPARILVVDDSVDTARGMLRLLKLLGHEVTVAHSGPEGIEAAREHRPDFILLDIGLPGMDGYEVASRLGRKSAARTPSSSPYRVTARTRTAGLEGGGVRPPPHQAPRPGSLIVAPIRRG